MDTCSYSVTSVQTDARLKVRMIASTSDPLATVPPHEQWLWKNSDSMQSLARAKEDVRAGRVFDLGSFAEFVDLEDED